MGEVYGDVIKKKAGESETRLAVEIIGAIRNSERRRDGIYGTRIIILLDLPAPSFYSTQFREMHIPLRTLQQSISRNISILRDRVN